MVIESPIVANSIQLRLVEVDDASFILRLRRDPILNQHLSPVDDDLQAQIAWIEEYKTREALGHEFYFVIEAITDPPRPVGTVRLYDFREQSFCWGSWIVDATAPRFAAIESAIAVYDLAFDRLGFCSSHFDVRKENVSVVRFHQRFGATETDEDESNVYFSYQREVYRQIRPKYARHLQAS